MTFDDLSALLDYNYWARDRLLDAVSALTLEQFTRPLGSSFSSVRDTIAHICDAESIWLARWNGKQPTGFRQADRITDVAAARSEWAELETGTRTFLSHLGPEGVMRSFEYKDMRGNARSDVFGQMVQHLVNHGTYHRGQVTTLLRQLGAQPAKSMDLITYYRQKQERV
ncbi:MAG TPA: DinB family protein [Terracidiphilus sp.]|nr:DinB family protein [Terracidiphilus sp.]